MSPVEGRGIVDSLGAELVAHAVLDSSGNDWGRPVFAKSADAAIDAWERERKRGEPFDAVLSVLEPGAEPHVSPDFLYRRHAIASGIAIFDWVRHHGGAAVPLVAVVDSHGSWSPDTLFALAAGGWLGAYILDRGWRYPGGDPVLVPPINAPADPALVQADSYLSHCHAVYSNLADSVWGALQQLEAHHGRGALSRPVGHALAWLRLLCELDFDPNLLWAIGHAEAVRDFGRLTSEYSLRIPDDLACPLSQKTAKKRLADTFNVFAEVAGAFIGAVAWPKLPGALPDQFWESPGVRTARHFIDQAFGFLVYEDIDQPWREFTRGTESPMESGKGTNEESDEHDSAIRAVWRHPYAPDKQREIDDAPRRQMQLVRR